MDDRVAARLAAQLSDPAKAIPATALERRDLRASQPGLYAWWADDAGAAALAAGLGQRPGNPIYAGQAGATRWPSGTPSGATLASRIRTNHLGGNIASSTFRHTLAAGLRRPLALELAGPNRFTPDSNRRLSEWIRDHLAVALAPYGDRDSLTELEAYVLAEIDPPLNVDGRPRTLLRVVLAARRTEVRTASKPEGDVET